MDFDKLIGNCQTLEKTVSILVKSNSSKQAELTRLQTRIFDDSQVTLNELIDKERQLQDKLDTLKYKKNDLDTEVKQYSDINEKLSDLVTIVQKEDRTDDEDNDCKNDDMSFAIIEALSDYDQFKKEHCKTVNKVEQMSECVKKETHEIDSLIKANQELIVELHRNDSVLRLSCQQNKYAEQQFDLILNQIPWEPLTTQYIDELRKSSDQSIRDIAENLKLQKSEIGDLTDAIHIKKAKKLDVLENLYSELNVFVNKRDEANLMTRFND